MTTDKDTLRIASEARRVLVHPRDPSPHLRRHRPEVPTGLLNGNKIQRYAAVRDGKAARRRAASTTPQGRPLTLIASLSGLSIGP